MRRGCRMINLINDVFTDVEIFEKKVHPVECVLELGKKWEMDIQIDITTDVGSV
jgi:hypothetical protein